MNSIQALDIETGKVVWSIPLGEIAAPNVDRSQDRFKWDYENERSRRLAATNEVVIAQGSQGITALDANTGRRLWQTRGLSAYGDADPLILQRVVLMSSVKHCSVFALDLKTGKEVWRAQIPSCTYYILAEN